MGDAGFLRFTRSGVQVAREREFTCSGGQVVRSVKDVPWRFPAAVGCAHPRPPPHPARRASARQIGLRRPLAPACVFDRVPVQYTFEPVQYIWHVLMISPERATAPLTELQTVLFSAGVVMGRKVPLPQQKEEELSLIHI